MTMTNITNDFLMYVLESPIMIVDDNEINRIFLEKMLRARGFSNLLAVASAEEALANMDMFQPEMIILDIVMPGIDGFECCELIRRQEQYKDLPVLIQTTITEPELCVKAFEKGATDFISKPVYPGELYARVMVHLEKRYSLKTLRLYKSRIELELESARQLQQAILPGSEEIGEIKRRCHLDVAYYFQPSSEIGGDFWGMKELFPHQNALWMVDFSGHGVASALNAFRLQAYLKENSQLAARPGEYMSRLNDKLLHLLLRGQFATMFYGIVDTQSSQLFYACACSPHPVILRKSTGKAELIDGSGPPLGIGMHLYQTQTINFATGDILLLYSDAFLETPNAADEYITDKDIMELLENCYGNSSEAIRDILLGYFMTHAGDALCDDLTFAVCMRSAV